ncbi:30S ribosomal protein S12 methylthiotransferase RimO [Odoribacter sp. OttesenSCG-928-J03]|nr:30S ribosomal protein S12 methylthiotransferase RimO [Odoribacter sp. OttesenSCG-928-J03]MDL2330662.1 30S ribosomal protein S12 methylthiotransferase RimO [Odoribacter sp. OttesenSCG-928-A06]
MKVNVINLGCSKNLVDSELLLKQLENAGYETEVDAEQSDAEVVVINTCGFIGDAKEESVNTILEQAENKKSGICKHLLVMGCLSQRYGEELKNELPEVDAFYGKFDWQGILTYLGHQYDEALRNERQLTTPSHYAFLKIAEGCERKCSYCAIPIMTGEYKSRDIQEIIEECERLVKKGVKELIVIAQDLTYYGIDIYGKSKIADLIRSISDIKGVEWIRLHYAYPAGFPLDLLTVMRERSNVCKYLDIALQHCSDHMLKQMRRGITKQQTIDLIRKIREEVPGIFLRTTLMAGHPGETKEDFNELCQFVEEMKFERLGVFPYSHEEDTYCDIHYQDDVPEAVKKRRVEKIMKLQQEISEKQNHSLIGQTLKVIIDRFENDYYVGRTEYDSPEIDQEVLIDATNKLKTGHFYSIKIVDVEGYDLFGEVINS